MGFVRCVILTTGASYCPVSSAAIQVRAKHKAQLRGVSKVVNGPTAKLRWVLSGPITSGWHSTNLVTIHVTKQDAQKLESRLFDSLLGASSMSDKARLLPVSSFTQACFYCEKS